MSIVVAITALIAMLGVASAEAQVIAPAHPRPNTVQSQPQKSVATEAVRQAIWAPRPGNINHELLGTSVIAEEVLERYLDLHSSLDFAAAAEAARELIALRPQRPEGYYNLACSLARLNRFDEAISALDQAIDHGWRHLRHTWLDPDLATLRDHRKEAFRERAMHMAQLEHNERLRPKPLRNEDWQTIVLDLNTQIPALLDEFNVPGATVALVRDGEVVWNAAFGMSNAHANVPMVVHDQFQLQSPVDLMAVLAILQQTQTGLDLARTLAQADELNLRDRPQRLARGEIPRFIDVNRDLRARLLTLESEDRKVDANIRESRMNRSSWPLSQVIPRTLDWVVQAVEHVSGQTFYRYCQQYILAAADMQETLFVLPHRPRHRNSRAGSDDGDRVIVAQAGAELVIGHTRFGTPLTPVFRQQRTAVAPVRTTASDLARLIASILQTEPKQASALSMRNPAGRSDSESRPHQVSSQRPLPNLQSSLAEVLGSRRMQQVGLGLEVQVDSTVGGPRLQVIELQDGIGCLMRWYPANRSGIVVLFNSENGPEAAIRIAHAALGGE